MNKTKSKPKTAPQEKSGGDCPSASCSTWLSDEEKARIEKIFSEGAAKVATKPEHWVHGGDEGLSYCYDCCEKQVEALLKEKPDDDICIDGGWGTDGDSLEFCEDCGHRLYNTPTQYCCESELDHFEEHGFDPASEDDCYSMDAVVCGGGWGPYEDLPGTDFERRKRHEYYARLHAFCRKILESNVQGDGRRDGGPT